MRLPQSDSRSTNAIEFLLTHIVRFKYLQCCNAAAASHEPINKWTPNPVRPHGCCVFAAVSVGMSQQGGEYMVMSEPRLDLGACHSCLLAGGQWRVQVNIALVPHCWHEDGEVVSVPAATARAMQFGSTVLGGRYCLSGTPQRSGLLAAALRQTNAVTNLHS